MKRLTFKYDLRDCPPLEELEKFRQGTLPKQLDEDITHHLTFCKMCAAKVTVLQPETSGEILDSTEMPAGLMEKLNRIATEVRQKPRLEGKPTTPGNDVVSATKPTFEEHETAIKAYLMKTDEDFRKLAEEYEAYERQLEELANRPKDKRNILQEIATETKLRMARMLMKDKIQRRIRQTELQPRKK